MFDQKEITLMENYPKVKIREYNFHPLNANIAWEGIFYLLYCVFYYLCLFCLFYFIVKLKGNHKFAFYLVSNWEKYFKGKRILELGAATGVLSIWLKRQFPSLTISTSDYPDQQITENIAFNWFIIYSLFLLFLCIYVFYLFIMYFILFSKQRKLNGMEVAQHFGFAWGEEMNFVDSFNVIIGNDLMIYVKQHQNQVRTLKEFLFRNPRHNLVFLSWGRKPSKEVYLFYLFICVFLFLFLVFILFMFLFVFIFRIK
jgi:hypothetical protein